MLRTSGSQGHWEFDSPLVTQLGKVAGYGLPGRSAKAVLLHGDEGSTPLPSARAGTDPGLLVLNQV